MSNDALIAKKLAALSHPVRVAIVRRLVRVGPSGLAAGALGKPLGVAANALTFHLQKLAQVGLVDARREGQFMIYSACFGDLLELVDQLVGACCSDTAQPCGPRCPSAAGAGAVQLPAKGESHG